jgi:hypothetical protein
MCDSAVRSICLGARGVASKASRRFMAPISLGFRVAQEKVQRATRSKQSLLVFRTLRLLAGLGLAQGTTITGLNTQVHPGTPTTVIVAGASTLAVML